MSLDVAPSLADVLAGAAAGTPPPADGEVVVVAHDGSGGDRLAGAVLAFTDHAVVAADVGQDEVDAKLAGRGVPGVHGAEFLSWLSERTGALPGSLDVVLVGRGTGSGADGLLRADDLSHHRVARARRFRPDVDAYRHPAGGVLVLGRGLAGRQELAFEVDPESRNHGLGRNLVAAALALTPYGEPVFAQVAAGNVASLRTVLAAGFAPVAAEVLLILPGPAG